MPMEKELKADTSCFGGGLNRIIFGLNLLDPDVRIKEGQETLANMEKYKKARESAKIGHFAQGIQSLVRIFLESRTPAELQQAQADPTALKGAVKEHFYAKAREALGTDLVSAKQDELEPFLKTYLDGDYLAESIRAAAKSPSVAGHGSETGDRKG